MASKIFVGIYIVSLYLCAEARYCNENPCQLGGLFTPANGYTCIQEGGTAKCTCPTNPTVPYALDAPCRICSPANNPCTPSSHLMTCLETKEYGKAYACLCSSPSGPVVTATDFCDILIPVTRDPTLVVSTTAPISTSASTPAGSLQCYNGGNLVDGICHCLSGFVGTSCQQKDDSKLCDGITCQNKGVCANRVIHGTLKPICLCPYGTFGDYCHLLGALTSCFAGFCLNNGVCMESLIGSTRHAYCNCPVGYNGIRCETQYFKCTVPGLHEDTYMSLQGKYFQCNMNSGTYVLTHKSCPQGLRFNISKYTCVKF